MNAAACLTENEIANTWMAYIMLGAVLMTLLHATLRVTGFRLTALGRAQARRKRQLRERTAYFLDLGVDEYEAKRLAEAELRAQAAETLTALASV